MLSWLPWAYGAGILLAWIPLSRRAFFNVRWDGLGVLLRILGSAVWPLIILYWLDDRRDKRRLYSALQRYDEQAENSRIKEIVERHDKQGGA